MDLKQKTDIIVSRSKTITPHVYFNPPEGIRMEYPCVRITRTGVYTMRAENGNYLMFDRYSYVYITQDPEDPNIHGILKLFTRIRHASTVTKDNLYNENYVLYL